MEKETLETPTPESTPTPTTPAKPLSLPIVALVVIAALVVGGVGGYYLGKYQSQNIKYQTNDKVQTTNTPAETKKEQGETPATAIEEQGTDPTEGLTELINNYMSAVINNDWDTVRGYLTKGTANQMSEEIMKAYDIQKFEILSITDSPDENGFYYAKVKIYNSKGETLETQQGDPYLMLIKEDGSWRTLTWYFVP